MATEGFLLRDGAQLQAAANYWNPATKLFGQAGSGQFLVVILTAARTVTLASDPTATFYGILQNSPDQGQAADVGLWGISKAVSGAAFSAGAKLMVDPQGRLVLWVAAAHNYVVGQAIDPAGAANAIVTVALQGPGSLGIT